MSLDSAESDREAYIHEGLSIVVTVARLPNPVLSTYPSFLVSYVSNGVLLAVLVFIPSFVTIDREPKEGNNQQALRKA